MNYGLEIYPKWQLFIETLERLEKFMVEPNGEVGKENMETAIISGHQKLRAKTNASEEKMEADHEELRAPINACQKVTRTTIRVLHAKTEASIRAIRYAQTKFEGIINKRVEDLDPEIKGTRPDMQQLRTSPDERTRSFREEFNMRIRGVSIDIRVQADEEADRDTRREFRS
jgi:hypothetical protein